MRIRLNSSRNTVRGIGLIANPGEGNNYVSLCMWWWNITIEWKRRVICSSCGIRPAMYTCIPRVNVVIKDIWVNDPLCNWCNGHQVECCNNVHIVNFNDPSKTYIRDNVHVLIPEHLQWTY